MSEDGSGRFRIATTNSVNGETWRDDVISAGVYVFDEGGVPVGALAGLAPDESIKSARFTEDRLYLVTFVETDPLFIISLDDPAKPAVLSELKVEGYSAYLHQLNDTHLVGLGRYTEVEENKWGSWVNELGLQLSLFDVSDELAPVRDAVDVIGADGTESAALDDHHAFQCWAETSTIAFPVTETAEDDDSWSPPVAFQGVVLYDATHGLDLAATVTHLPQDYFDKQWICFFDCPEDYPEDYDYRYPDFDEEDDDWCCSSGNGQGSWEKTQKSADLSGYAIDRVQRRDDHVYTFSAGAVVKGCPLAPDGNCPDLEPETRVELDDPAKVPTFAWTSL
jgi:hypothetical protein